MTAEFANIAAAVAGVDNVGLNPRLTDENAARICRALAIITEQMCETGDEVWAELLKASKELIDALGSFYGYF